MSTLTWIFLYLILPMALGILGNFATPWVKSYIENRSLTTKQRRIKILVARYRDIKKKREHPAYFNLVIWKTVTTVLALLIALSGLVGSIAIRYSIPDVVLATGEVTFVDYFPIVVVPVLGIFGMWAISKDIDAVLGFDKFKEKTVKKLKELGGNPEDLDKEEANG